MLKAKDDVVERTFQDLTLKVRKRASKQIQNFLFASNRCTLYSNKEKALDIYWKMKNDIRKI